MKKTVDHVAKSADLRLQRSHKLLLIATFALASVCSVCVMSSNMETRSLLRDVTDAIGLILKTSRDLSMDIRRNILNAPQVSKKSEGWPLL